MNLSVSHWDNTIGYASGSNPYKFGEPGYYSFLQTGSNTSANASSNGDTLAAMKAIQFLQNRSGAGAACEWRLPVNHFLSEDPGRRTAGCTRCR